MLLHASPVVQCPGSFHLNAPQVSSKLGCFALGLLSRGCFALGSFSTSFVYVDPETAVGLAVSLSLAFEAWGC